MTPIKEILLVLFALGTFERLLLAGETPMAREKSKNTHVDCRGNGCTVEEELIKMLLSEIIEHSHVFSILNPQKPKRARSARALKRNTAL